MSDVAGEVVLREAELADAPSCCDLDRRCFPPVVAYDLRTFRLLCTFAHVRIVAEMDRRLVGMIFAELDRANESGLIITVDVDPELRRQGLGRRLMDLAERELASLGARTVLVHVYLPHAEAQHMYLSRGYVLKETLPAYYGPGSDALLMAKTLR